MSTYYIAPPPAGVTHCAQSRIYRHEGEVKNARDHYREHPEQWAEVGLMNFEGKLVCLDAPPEVWDELKASEPLMAGVAYTY